MEKKLGSLFDGIGGFPLAAKRNGIRPIWASEIEKFPMAVTRYRFPEMTHMGDITKLHGENLPVVDIIAGGSPCQDLSVAGRREGLAGVRSGLFLEQIRIVKEMRKQEERRQRSSGRRADVPVRPRYMVWENVPGAFSSNGGEDFRCVLEAICSVKDSSISIPRPAGKWTKAGEVLAESYSLAYRVLDAQYWGVPQRRKRIFLVADFDGTSAGKILFESEGLSGYSAESLRAWQRTAGSAADSFGTAGLCLCDQGGERIDILKERTATLRAEAHHPPCILENHPADSRLQISENGKVQTLTSRCGTGGGNVPLLMDTPKTLKIRCGKAGGGKGGLIQENKSATLSCNNDQTVFQPKAYGISSFSSNAMLSGNPHSGIYEADTARTLDTSDQSPAKNQGGIAVLESYALQGSMVGRSDQNGPQGGGVNKEVAFTLNATDHHAVYAASTGNFSSAFRETTPTLLARDHKDPSIVSSGYAVRRLTPQECARLQGFPDQWCSDLAPKKPTEEEIDRWAAIFEEYRKAVKPESRPKSRKMVQKWLQDPYRDAEEYRLWGNGICLNVAVFVLAGIVWADL